jgi:hypothetical protein
LRNGKNGPAAFDDAAGGQGMKTLPKCYKKVFEIEINEIIEIKTNV